MIFTQDMKDLISFEDLLSCKKKSDRLKDLADADELERMLNGKTVEGE
jgi:hypothetical protein